MKGIITDLNYSIYKYVPTEPYVNNLISDLEHLIEALNNHKKICTAAGVGQITSGHMHSNANAITNYADNMLIQHTQTFIQNCAYGYPFMDDIDYLHYPSSSRHTSKKYKSDGPQVDLSGGLAGNDTPETIDATKIIQDLIDKSKPCDHNWSEADMANYQCTQCNCRIKSLPCENCSHNDAIRCHNDFVCTKCNTNKCMIEQPPEFRAYQAAQDAIRDGTADESNPIIKYTKRCLDLQIAYYEKEFQKTLDEQNAALLDHIKTS